MVQVDFPAYAPSIHKQNGLELQKAITHRIGSSPNFSIINVHLVDINVFAKFDEILIACSNY